MGKQGQTLFLVTLTVLLLAACSQPALKRAAHDILQQHRCEQSQARGSCQRSWNDEYAAWQAQYVAYQAALAGAETAERDAGLGWYEPPTSVVIRAR